MERAGYGANLAGPEVQDQELTPSRKIKN